MLKKIKIYLFLADLPQKNGKKILENLVTNSGNLVINSVNFVIHYGNLVINYENLVINYGNLV